MGDPQSPKPSSALIKTLQTATDIDDDPAGSGRAAGGGMFTSANNVMISGGTMKHIQGNYNHYSTVQHIIQAVPAPIHGRDGAEIGGTGQPLLPNVRRPRFTKTRPDPRAAVPLLRAYSGSSRDHFYTTSPDELLHFTTHLGYKNEGTAGYIFASQEPGTVPWYRLYSDGAQDHFYTTDEEECVRATELCGYDLQIVAGFIYRPPGMDMKLEKEEKDGEKGVQGMIPLWRLWGMSDHFYTTDLDERDRARKNLGFSLEQTPGYIYPF